jgi:hypothetical protein
LENSRNILDHLLHFLIEWSSVLLRRQQHRPPVVDSTAVQAAPPNVAHGFYGFAQEIIGAMVIRKQAIVPVSYVQISFAVGVNVAYS